MEAIKNSITTLSLSDIIQLCSVLVALIIGVISIVISIATLWQNSAIVRDANRAYITVSPFYIYGNMFPRIRIKNFGNTAGIITDIIAPSSAMSIFQHYIGCSLSPNQSFTTIFTDKNTPNADPLLDEFDISITYKTLGKAITETIHINYRFQNAYMETVEKPRDTLSALTKIHQSIQGLEQK